jgi:hypothetical protein
MLILAPFFLVMKANAAERPYFSRLGRAMSLRRLPHPDRGFGD